MNEIDKKKIYISGSISNNPDYANQFQIAYNKLVNDYRVLSPMFIKCELTWEEYMAIDLAMVKVCDAIYMLKGWEDSKGANIELGFAQELNKEIIFEED